MEAIAQGSSVFTNFEIKRMKCYCLILSTEWIEGNFRPFAIIPERGFLIPSIFLALWHFKYFC